MINVNDFDFNILKNNLQTVTTRNRDNQYIEYYNAPFAFDIETSSFYDGENKRACMYIFMFALNGNYVYGRTWEDFDFTLNKLREVLQLNEYRRIIIYIHNLGYEFQFLIGHERFKDVFARNARHPIKCTMNDCFDLKCSLMLSGMSLAKTADDLTNVKIQKLTGDLDYKLLRTWKTSLTKEEFGYCEHDVKILHYFILEEMAKNDNDITKIPLTKTGYVRKYCQNYIKKHTYYPKYREKIKKIAPVNKDLFCLLHKSFMGGYTHANYMYVGMVLENVSSIDFTSSYPSVMIRKKYPMQPFTKTHIKDLTDFRYCIKNYPCVFEVELTNITSKKCNHILSRSKCSVCDNAVVDNGRIVSADRIFTYFTDIDFKDFEQFYSYEHLSIGKFYTSSYGYLPKQIIECALKFYNDKTTLKGVAGKEVEYLVGKGMLNSLFGMCVTNPVNDDIVFNGKEWNTEKRDISEALQENYIKNKKQVLVYQWGVWITAWARHELFKGILEINDDVIYCDTDSIKFLNYENYENWINEYNKNCINEINKALNYYEIDLNLAKPKTIKGIEKPLGVWDFEGIYNKFKTLGAKRYAYEQDEKFNITVSGLNKKRAVPYIVATLQPFEFFDNEMYIPKEYTGKNTLTYINDPYKIMVKDYQGNYAEVEENTYIHMEEQDYNMSLSEQFIHYLMCGTNFGNGAKEHALFEKSQELATNFWECDYNEK
nr:MAG TPA: DNA polymerase B [Caudoviricetes sp.]